MLTIGELIDKLHEMADEIGDDAEVVLGCSDNASLYTLSVEDINNILLIDHSAHCYHEGVELCGRKHNDIEAVTTVATAAPSAKDFIKWLTSPEHAWQFNGTGDDESVVADGYIVFNEDIEQWMKEQEHKQ